MSDSTMPVQEKNLSSNNIISCRTVLNQGFWRGNQGFTRTIPFKKDGTPNWCAASDWSAPIPISALPGSGDIQSQNAYVSPGKFLVQSFWRGNQGFTRTVPFNADCTPNWPAASPWSAPIGPSILPGCGDIQAQSGFVSANGTILFQTVWQGNQGFTRTVPFKADGTPDWPAASPWSTPIPTCHLPGCGDIQSFNEF